MTQNKKIAVTGGIGSGKSTVCDLLRGKGYRVFSCDDINRDLWQNDGYLAQLKELFPQCVTDGKLDKARLSSLIFSEKAALELLNAFSHPIIIKRLLESMDRVSGVCFAEVPLLFEGGFRACFDEVLVVKRAAEDRISSVSARDRASREQVLARMNSQYSYDGSLEAGCYIIENDGTKQALEQKLNVFLSHI